MNQKLLNQKCFIKRTDYKSARSGQQNNKPIELWSEKVIKQKIDYSHNNPVTSGFVTKPEDWKYSSARNYQEDTTVLEIDYTGFLGQFLFT